MEFAGIITEYDPFHNGHAAQIAAAKSAGAGCVAVCMSSGAVQRGGVPVLPESVRVCAALDAGADDYVPKPFRMMELLSRIRALIRRAEGYNTLPESEEYHIDGLELSPSRHLVRVNGQEIALTFKEFELLCLLVENRGIVLSRDKILDKVWQDTMGRESRTVDVHIRTLRHKLGTIGGRIETVRGVGYKFKAEE